MPNTELPMDLESQVVLMKKYITSIISYCNIVHKTIRMDI